MRKKPTIVPEPVTFRKNSKYQIDGPGASGVGVYQSRYYNKEVSQWMYEFKVSLGHYFTVPAEWVTKL